MLHCLVGVVVFLGLSAVRADEGDEAPRLVKQLADESFEVRAKAASRLLELGPAARAALEAGLKSEDAEVRAACRKLLGQIQAEGYAEQLDALLAGRLVEGKPLPGWKRFAAVAGDGEEAR